MEVKLVIKEEIDGDCDKTNEFIRTIYTHFPNARWAGNGPGKYVIDF